VLSSEAREKLTAAEGTTVEYRGASGVESVGSARRLVNAPWIVVADMPAAEAYALIDNLRNVTFLVVGLLLLGIALVGYQLGTVISRPLDRLTGAAAQVSAGNLTVGLPEAGGGEVGYLTRVFNDMVTHLRTTRAELEKLSATDALTGLHNRRHVMQALADETQRARRHQRGYSVIMADVDLFKAYNDEFGHQAGDEVLKRFAAVLGECTRGTDTAARYGGEEFIVLLPEAPGERAGQVAERIRERMEGHQPNGKRVTVSLGVAEFPSNGDTGEAVIGAADAALYQAKREGRNRVIRAASAAPAPARTGATMSGKKKTG
jgi:diguanylate cyclase (GGDEF)-like protein